MPTNATDASVTVIVLHGDYSLTDLALHARANTGTEDVDALAIADLLTEGS